MRDVDQAVVLGVQREQRIAGAGQFPFVVEPLVGGGDGFGLGELGVRQIRVGQKPLGRFAVDDLDTVDVRWPRGRCFEAISGLLPAIEDQNHAPAHPLEPVAGPDSNGTSSLPIE